MELTAWVLAAPDVDARTRDEAARTIGEPPPGVLLLRTCHRLEVLGTPHAVRAVDGLARARRLDAEDAARHVLRVAVGLESTVIAEDQVLHQLRAAVRAARARGALPPTLGHLLDTALRAGRRARSWLPADRPGLADVALDRVMAGGIAPGAVATVIGRGPMGRGLAHALATRGARVVQLGRDGVPAPDSVGVAIALAGAWRPGPGVMDHLVGSGAWVVDLSAPSALDPGTLRRFVGRVVSIDDLGADAMAVDPLGRRLRERLEALVLDALEEHRTWVAHRDEHRLARLRASRAGETRIRELEALWRRLPDLEPGQREEIERMAERLSERLLFGR